MQATTPLMPWPQRMALSGELLAPARLSTDTGVDPRLLRALDRLNAMLHPTGRDILNVAFRLARQNPGVPTLGDDESFRLEIARDGVTVSARGTWGALHALTTLAQLADSSGRLPIGRIEDAPRFPWRGLMVDVVRHFISAQALYDTIDVMAFYKLNVLHLHLSDDQGFRMPSDAYPKLSSVEHYSHRELRELVQRAADRGIRVVPELDMPGHVTSWLAACPHWAPSRRAEGGERRRPQQDTAGEAAGAWPVEIQASRRFGVHEAVLNVADEAVYTAIDALLGELADLFPDDYVHMGGDEVNPAWWHESAEVLTYMAQHELDDVRALQAHFNERVAALASGHGKRLIGWDEVLNGGAPAGLVVQAWRGATARDRALGAGHACVESSGYYLDLFYPAGLHHAWDPAAPLDELLAREDAMLEDPRFQHVADGLKWTRRWRETTNEQSGAESDSTDRGDGKLDGILGGEACLWSELVDERVLPVRLWSRMPAVAERLWSSELPDEELDSRLEASLALLAEAGRVDVRQTSRKLLLESGVLESQLDAVELLEPVKWYGRLLGDVALEARIEGAEMPESRPYGTETPLNRPVDALLPESFAAKRFARLLSGDEAPLRRECTRLLGICGAGAFAPDLQGPVDRLAELLATLLEVLDGRIESDAARSAVAATAEPSGEYLVAVAPAVQVWLNAR